MTDKQVYPVTPEVAQHALINKDQYQAMYKQSIENPDQFWAEHGKRVDRSSRLPKSKTPLTIIMRCPSNGLKMAN